MIITRGGAQLTMVGDSRAFEQRETFLISSFPICSLIFSSMRGEENDPSWLISCSYDHYKFGSARFTKTSNHRIPFMSIQSHPLQSMLHFSAPSSSSIEYLPTPSSPHLKILFPLAFAWLHQLVVDDSHTSTHLHQLLFQHV